MKLLESFGLIYFSISIVATFWDRSQSSKIVLWVFSRSHTYNRVTITGYSMPDGIKNHLYEHQPIGCQTLPEYQLYRLLNLV